jgi:FAD/FMN-containing dehydrogenase
MDAVGPMPYVGMYQLTAAAAAPSAEVVRSAFLGGLDAAGAEAIVERHSSPAGATAMTQLRVLGGAMGRVPAEATAFAHRGMPLLAAVMAVATEAPDEATAFADGLLADIVGNAETGVYSNFLADEDESRLRRAYPGATYERLVAVKRRVDPANVFGGNHNIRP